MSHRYLPALVISVTLSTLVAIALYLPPLSDAAPAAAEGLSAAATDTSVVEWIRVPAPGGGSMIAAVARPEGTGPFPAVVVLHGTHGFAKEYVQIARELARRGVIGVAACWFSGPQGAGMRFITSLPCTESPPLSDARSPVAQQSVDALVRAVAMLPGVRHGGVALFGHSRGAGAVVNYVLGGGAVQAAILCSSGYTDNVIKRAATVQVPILILHGVADGPADGGTAQTSVGMARAFEAALRQAGKPVEAKYYDGAGHNGVFTKPKQLEDQSDQIAAFVRRHLVP